MDYFEAKTREIFIQGEGAFLLVQLPISFLISFFEKQNFNFLLFQQLSLKLIDNCTSGNAPSPCMEISLQKHFWIFFNLKIILLKTFCNLRRVISFILWLLFILNRFYTNPSIHSVTNLPIEFKDKSYHWMYQRVNKEQVNIISWRDMKASQL